MKSTFSEEYYRMNWEKFIKKAPGGHYINLESDLDHELEIYAELPTEPFEILKKVVAKKIADRCTETLKKDMKMLREIKTGKAALGYTTQTQEIHAMHELVTRFEFNCLQLADFKKKYGIS